jgi:hypothetical protein
VACPSRSRGSSSTPYRSGSRACDTGYGTALDAYLKALATAFLPLGGGTNSLTAELDLGASFGLKSIYFKSATVNPASAQGILRLGKADSMKWRNNANSGDLALAIDTADALLFNGANVTGNPFLDASSTAGQSIANGATEVIVVFGTGDRGLGLRAEHGHGAVHGPDRQGRHYQVSGQIAYNTAPTGTCTLSVYKNAASSRARSSSLPALPRPSRSACRSGSSRGTFWIFDRSMETAPRKTSSPRPEWSFSA